MYEYGTAAQMPLAFLEILDLRARRSRWYRIEYTEYSLMIEPDPHDRSMMGEPPVREAQSAGICRAVNYLRCGAQG